MSVYYTMGLFHAKVGQPKLENHQWRSRWTIFNMGQISSEGSCSAETKEKALQLAEKDARSELRNLNNGG